MALNGGDRQIGSGACTPTLLNSTPAKFGSGIKGESGHVDIRQFDQAGKIMSVRAEN